MKKIVSILFAGLMISAQMTAVTAKDVCGQFDGNLNIGGSPYPNKSIYLLPGTVENTVTFVLPDFMYNAGKLGNIVLPNIPMSENGMLTLENATLYLDSISERATITVINGLEDEGYVYNSIITATEAQVILSIAAPSLPESIFVLFQGVAANNKNYVLPNGGFEGTWTKILPEGLDSIYAGQEPQGWHSFTTATGLLAPFVISNGDQFIPSSETAPASAGKLSALISSKMIFGQKANGNITNGRMNAGSMTADDAANNFNFSDPDSVGFNTPFHGRPDSIVFWAKYLPADRDAANEVNRARMSTIITTNARYQDPEADNDYSAVRLATATINYAATASMGWQRLAVPFTYEENNLDKQPALILTTFTTNMVPGGGSSYSSGTINKTNVLDSVYLDDVEMVYNKTLTRFAKGADELSFTNHVAVVADNYCDDCAKFAAAADGRSSQTFIAFDAAHKCIFIYVIADDYAQSGAYNLYRVDFADSDTAGLEPIDNPEQGVDNIFTNGTQAEKVIRNGQLLIRRGNNWYSITGVRLQ